MSVLHHHNIRFVGLPGTGGPVQWEAWLKNHRGIKEARVHLESGAVFVEYDLLECKEADIEQWIAEAGFVLDGSLMERIRRGWVHYTEDNELASLRAAHACCDMEKRKTGRKEKTR